MSRLGLLIAVLPVLGPACSTHHIVGAGSDIGPCHPPDGGDDLPVCTATYVGRGGTPSPAGVAIQGDGTVIVAGTWPNTSLPGVARQLLPGSSGAVLRLGAEGRVAAGTTLLGDAITDMDLMDDGAIVVAGSPFGVAVLEPDASRLRWQHPLAADRVAVGEDGHVVALDRGSRSVTLLSSEGILTASFIVELGADLVDVALDSSSETIVVAGTINGQRVSPLLLGLDSVGSVVWRDYGWTAAEMDAAVLQAATHAVTISVARDGKLHYAGWSDGGNTVHLHDPRDLTVPAPLFVLDNYGQSAGIGSNNLGFSATFDPVTGTIEEAQITVARPRGGGSPVSLVPSALAADAAGNQLLGGVQDCCAPGADTRLVAGTPVVEVDGDAFALMTTAEFASRPLWTTFGTGGVATARGVALGGGFAALLAVQDRTTAGQPPLVTANALVPVPSDGGPAVYLAVWRVQ